MKSICILIAVSLFVPLVMAANPVPFLSQPLVPTSVAPGGAAFTLTVNGTGFVASSVVNFNGSPQPTTFVSQGQLKAQIASSEIATAGTSSITVSSGGPASNTVFLPILKPVSSISFAPNTGAARGPFIGSVIEADFNGDGKPDLAYSTGDNLTWAQSWTVGIALGNGDGTFQRAGQYKTIHYPGALAADINGDGHMDLIVLGSSYAFGPVDISVLLGNGDGTFQPPKNYATSVSGTSSAFLVDLNRDGKLDLAFDNGAFIAVLPGNGDGTFQHAILSSDVGGYDLHIGIGDFNNDGKLDMAFISVFESSLLVALGNGDGTFQPSMAVSPNPISADQIVVADFNGDGIVDLATASDTGVLIWLGKGDGTFATGILSNDDPIAASGMASEDLNGDGMLDLVLAHGNVSHVSYLLGNGDGTFKPFEVLNRPSPADLVLGDFNGDGRMDFAIVTNNGSDNGNSTVSTTLQKP